MNIKKIIVVSIVFFHSLVAVAGTVVCSGKVEVLAYHANDKLMIKLDSMNHNVFFCSPDSKWSVLGTSHTTSPNTCKTMYSTFLAAKISGKTIKDMYFDGDDVPSSCNKWEAWKKANIRYYSF
ncbi:hypothetical protein [Arcobacter sp. LA11]|uniref:hypothetical protein n=1 Tax=Arcobacter sp. LA11 TaxID=1898176 RepID=UPI0009330A4D|nr:hypothetical protein [Arcobacter sp. LA11]